MIMVCQLFNNERERERNVYNAKQTVVAYSVYGNAILVHYGGTGACSQAVYQLIELLFKIDFQKQARTVSAEIVVIVSEQRTHARRDFLIVSLSATQHIHTVQQLFKQQCVDRVEFFAVLQYIYHCVSSPSLTTQWTTLDCFVVRSSQLRASFSTSAVFSSLEYPA